jgi:hypothetical protein
MSYPPPKIDPPPKRRRPLKAWLNQLRDLAVQASGFDAEAPLALQRTPAGWVLRLIQSPEFTARITGAPSGTAYPWQAVYPTAGGSWSDDASTISGTTTHDPAFEFNGNTQVPVGTRVLLRVYKNEKRFQLGLCSTSSTTSTPILSSSTRTQSTVTAGSFDPRRLSAGSSRGISTGGISSTGPTPP